MSMRDDQVCLDDMLSHAREALQLLGSRTSDDLQNDRVLQLALTRLIEIIGEAANRVSPTTQANCPSIPWPQIIGMRNRLIHGYDVIDYGLLRDTITNDLPPLIETLQKQLRTPPNHPVHIHLRSLPLHRPTPNANGVPPHSPASPRARRRAHAG